MIYVIGKEGQCIYNFVSYQYYWLIIRISIVYIIINFEQEVFHAFKYVEYCKAIAMQLFKVSEGKSCVINQKQSFFALAITKWNISSLFKSRLVH